MFNKSSQSSGNTTIIGRGARFTGTLELEGEIHIEGQCEGTVRANAGIAIGSQGSMRGELSGGAVLIAGRAEGTIVAKETLHVLKSGSLRGDIYYGQLMVDPGGVIDGTSHQGAPPPMLEAADAAQSSATAGESSVFDTRPRSVAPEAKPDFPAVTSR
jgi:cytoskeletal protein CcmA (bactofilin family)